MELLQVADAVAREKNIDRTIVLEAMEEAIQKAGRSKYGHDHDIRAHIDRKTGLIGLKRYREVVETIENVEDEVRQLTLPQAQRIKKDAVIGEFLVDDLPPLDFGRIAAQTAKQVIVQKVREAEREKQFEEFKDRVGEVISGVVKRVEYGNTTIDIGGKGEGLLRRDESLPREHFKTGDRVRAYIYDVRQEQRGPQIFLSRSHPQFMAALFKQEVPEIYDGVIEIKAVARDPGSRAKIAVVSRDSSIDPVGACVGMRGSRVQAVVGELQGEKIDIVPWSSDIASFIVNALQPAAVAKVVLDEDKKRMDVVVPEEQLSLAIGRRGQNVRLASMLCGWDIDIMTEAEESARRAEEFKVRSSLFIEALDVDEVIAHLLVAEGFASIEEIADTSVDEMMQIQGFDEDVGIELINRANTWLEELDRKLKEQSEKLGIQEDLLTMEGLAPQQIIKLGEAGIKSKDDFADLATDELVEILGESAITRKNAESLIMAARASWFAEEEQVA
ncbi:MAG: transcription termination/antitermination protein NusA [Micavibrio aeruginosavorus]|uniref:Transcription termination/antitermination protein NusA n=1 Tax=Micavibrio aeruginosavorus TaxID=349221 RepID=A0A2W5MTH0_9BACT|nr:MAG: transcription termination/antitermination protein NusA [Micavibrio aeruginosavorus]